MTSQETESSVNALQELLNRHRTGELAEYNVTANHAPMVLIALYRLGAESDRLHQYYAGIGIEPASATGSLQPQPIDRSTWTKYLGNFGAWSSYRSFFQREIGEHGVQDVLASYVSPLMRGVAGHAFHPLLRVGYGIDLNDKDEIAFGLAYWAAAYLPAPEIPSDQSSVEPSHLMSTLENSRSLRSVKPNSQSIAHRIGQFYAHEEFRRLLRPIDLDSDRPLETIARTIAEAFVEHHHFTMLHGVTSCHAIRMVLPYCKNQQDALNVYWYSVCAAYLSVINMLEGTHHSLPDRDVDWRRIQGVAIATGNEHTIKLAYTCLKESEAYHHPIYRSLALREIDTPSPFV
jgi:hypothetical protein